MFNGLDILDESLEVDGERTIEGVRIQVTTRVSEVTGRIVERAGQPIAGGTAIIFSRDTHHWRPRSRRIRTARSATDGTYSIRGLPPGRYAVVAALDIDPQKVFQASVLQEFLSRSATFPLADGERRVQDVVTLDIR